ncbi:centromere protein C-like isoform X2 [Protopterus annectens]|uniref:centromere protein C-like isoform X2 n=1 Tax=Protopterus annectens TaxID=7888 RepID=UPI001CFBA478|nr:centromere protein C-like isoform X2 [Protopterus annectens]
MATEVQDNMEQSDLECGGHSGFTMPKHQRDRKQRHNMIIMSDDSESSVEESEGELEEYSPFIHGSGPTCHTARFRSPIESPVAFQDQTEDDSPVAFCKPKLVFPSNTPHVRRSRRTRVIPLEYWRGERADYQQRPSGGFSLACILSPEKRKTPYKSNRRGQKKKLQTEGNCVNKVLRVPETEPQMYSVVLDEHGNEIRMACIKTAAKVPTTLQSDVLAIHKNLIYSNFSAGKLVLGPYIEKEYQYVYNNSLVFYIITGSLSVTLYRTSYTLQTGDYFFVPPGNCYSIKNMTDSNALLTFTQIKTAEQEPLLPSQEFLCPHRR